MLQLNHDPPTIPAMGDERIRREVQTSIRLTATGMAELRALMGHYRGSMGQVIERLIQERHAEVFPAKPSRAKPPHP